MQLVTQNHCICWFCILHAFQPYFASHGTRDAMPNGITRKMCLWQPNLVLEVPKVIREILNWLHKQKTSEDPAQSR